MKAKLFRTNGTIQRVKPANGEKFTLEELQSFVGGYFDILPLTRDVVLVFNDEGRHLKLPYNELISKLVHYIFVGDCLICERNLID